MIIKGTSRSGPRSLAAHLGNAEKNEKVTLLETRGTVADDLQGALIEMDAYRVGTQCEKALYHAAMSPEPPHRLSPEQRSEAIDALEKKMGFDGQPRVVVMHEKHGREHIHIVWSRINLETNRAISDSHNYRKHEEVARDLERRFGHERVQGAHHEREGVERPDRTATRAELRQEERTGIRGKVVKAEVTAAFRASDTAEAFKAALEDKHYVLAQGDRRDFVVIDRAGGIHSLARRIDGIKAADLREFMSSIDRSSLPSADQAKEIAEERYRTEKKAREALDDGKIEKDYSRGADYVSQTTAAQKEHADRQGQIENDFADAPKRSKEKDEEENLNRQAAETTERQQADMKPAVAEAFKSGASEMSDAKQERLSRLLKGIHENDRHSELEDDPDRQRGAPGGGRTRSR